MTQPLEFAAPEEQARANFYGLLARLFYAPPDASLLGALANSDELDAEDEALAARWRELVAAAATTEAQAVRAEYDEAFVGTGKAPVTLYACAYSIRYTNETPLAALRGDLAALGLARREQAGEPEDHIAALCDTMRHLISGDQRPLDEQRRFFEHWISPNYEALCSAIEASERTSFYRCVARMAKAFFSVEQAAFEML
ncbi:MAG TPA: molecular chaperone TorD family protein [Burkholderiales bacterium]|nr:molecular chaperone TorD family protein [Burkholderiales bacterium]